MIALKTQDTDWFFRILEIRKNPEMTSHEEILKMADDLVLYMCSMAPPSFNSKSMEAVVKNCPLPSYDREDNA